MYRVGQKVYPRLRESRNLGQTFLANSVKHTNFILPPVPDDSREQVKEISDKSKKRERERNERMRATFLSYKMINWRVGSSSARSAQMTARGQRATESESSRGTERERVNT